MADEPETRTAIERDLRRILVVQAIRAALYGFGTVVLGTALAASGLTDTQVGLVFTAMLAGMALATIGIGVIGDRIGRRRSYVVLLVLLGISGTVFALTSSFAILIVAALTGTMSTDANESGPITSLEQAMIGQAPPATRLHVFGRYNAVAFLAGAFGALAAGGPAFVRAVMTGAPTAQRWLLLFPVGALACLLVARTLSPAVEAAGASHAQHPLERSRKTVFKLSSLFALDAFAGGFVVTTFVVFWFERKFGASSQVMSLVVFAGGLLQAGSSIMASRVGARFGLLNTMVFSHLPSNVLLDPHPGDADARLGDRGAVAAVRPVADGRAHPPGLHLRDGRPRGTDGRGGLHEHRPVRGPAVRAGDRHRADDERGVRRAVRGGGHAEERLRPAALAGVQARTAARRG